jgi:uncharacterized membrane protein/Tfp pilus assembly protein PilF
MKKSKKKQQQRNDSAAPERNPAGESHMPEGNSSPSPTFAISSVSWLAGLPSMLHWIFLLLVTPTFIFLAVCTPPFQSPDELAHFERAYQISDGGFYGGKGGKVDWGIDEVQSFYSLLPFKPGQRVTAADQAGADSVKWTGEKVEREFQNTAAYPPIDYIPQALGVTLGRIAGLSVVRTLLLSRLLNGAFAIFISTLALYWCRRGKLVMFALLLLPMTLSLFASCNQDAALISFTCLAFALVSRQIYEDAPLSLRMTIVLASALLIATLGRPPYASLLLVLFIPGILPRWDKKPDWLPGVSLAGLLVLLAGLWWLITSSKVTSIHTMWNGSQNRIADPGLQALYILHHPGVLVDIFTSIDFSLYADSFIGVLGWLDTVMPRPYYVAIELMFLVAIAGEMVYRSRFKVSASVVTLFAALSGVVGVIMSLYVFWTPVGEHIVEGIQGRYLIPMAIAGCIGLPRLMQSDRGYRLATVAIVLCQLLTFCYLPRTIIDRYYLIAEQPNFISERVYFADSLLAQGKLDRAAEEYRQVLAAEPNLYNAHNGLGDVYVSKGMTQDALKEFRLSLAIKSDQATPHLKIGRIFSLMHQYPDAIQEFTQTLQFDPANANAHNDLGIVFYQQKDYEKAAEQFSDAVRIDPGYAIAKKNLDIVEARLKNNMISTAR